MVGIWVFVLSDAVGFAALLTTMASLRLGSAGFSAAGASPDLLVGLSATALLGVVSLSVWLAGKKPGRARVLALVAVVAALAFCALQAWEYRALLGADLRLSTPALESFVVVTAYHLLHVLVGIVVLLWGLTRSPMPTGPLAVYWHFVDGLWLMIFAFFYLL